MPRTLPRSAFRTAAISALCCLLLGLPLAPPAPGAPLTGAEQELCSLLYGRFGSAPAGSPIAAAEPQTRRSLGATQIQRIDAFLSAMPQQDKDALYALLGKHDFRKLAADLRAGKVQELEKLFQEQPDLSQVLLDLVDFGDAFPGIFASPNAERTIQSVVKLVQRQEAAALAKNTDLLKSQAMAPRLRRTFDNTLINMIEQSDMEYSGMTFGRSGLEQAEHRVRRFFQPPYGRAQDLVQWTEGQKKQLQRRKAIDSLVIRNGISEIGSLGLTEPEAKGLVNTVLKSPREIEEIEKNGKAVFGESFAAGREVEIGKFNIYNAHDAMTKLDNGAIHDGFDSGNVRALDQLNDTINKARARKGIAPRGPRDFEPFEVQVRYEAAERQGGRGSSRYRGYTAEDANVSYTVERSHTRLVPDGVDDKGRPKFRSETYYEDERVTPSFENILSGSYDLGDRSVSGLNAVKDEAQNLVSREAGPRSLVQDAQETVSGITANWREEILAKGMAPQAQEKVQDQLQKIRQEIRQQESYLAWPQEKILAQYPSDTVTNFKHRNRWLLYRLRQAEAQLAMLDQSLQRQLPELYPFYDLYDYEPWLRNLRHHRNVARTIQGAGAAAMTGAGAIAASPGARAYIAGNAAATRAWLSQSLNRLRQAVPSAGRTQVGSAFDEASPSRREERPVPAPAPEGSPEPFRAGEPREPPALPPSPLGEAPEEPRQAPPPVKPAPAPAKKTAKKKKNAKPRGKREKSR